MNLDEYFSLLEFTGRRERLGKRAEWHCPSKGLQYDQMAQAACSGRQNIIEGSESSTTSKDTELN